jgi:sulfur carrier protein
MRIIVNGEPRDVPDSITVRQVVEMVSPPGAAAAAEVNQRLVPRREQETTVLSEGDRVEVVTLVGGG